MTDRVGYEPKGMRDVHWCWLQNDPFILGWDLNTDQALCPFGCPPRDSEPGPARDYWESEHPFIAHVWKPPAQRSTWSAPPDWGEVKVMVGAEDIGLIEDGAEGESRRWWCRVCNDHGPDAENDAEAWRGFVSEHVPEVHR